MPESSRRPIVPATEAAVTIRHDASTSGSQHRASSTMQPSGQQRTNPDTNRSTRFERLLNGSVGNENIRLTPRALSSLDLSTGDEGVPTTTFGQAVASYFNRLTKSFWTRRRASDDHNQANGEDGLEMETWPPSGTQLRHQHTPSSDTDTSFASESRDGFSDLSSKRSSNTIYEDLNESIQTYDKDERSGTTTFPPIADSSAGATSKQTQQAIDSYSSNSVDDNSFSVASTDSNSDFERYNQPTPEAEQEITRWGTCPAIVHPKSTNGKGKRREAIVQLDTGSHYDAIAGSCADKLGLKRELENTFVQSFNGEYIMLKEFVLLVIEIDGRGFQRKLLVVEGEPGWDILFGRGTTMERGLLSKTGRLSRSMNVIGRVNPDKLRPDQKAKDKKHRDDAARRSDQNEKEIQQQYEQDYLYGAGTGTGAGSGQAGGNGEGSSNEAKKKKGGR